MDFGSAYYPEHFDASKVREDAELMKKANLNLARMGEFAWIAMEPDDGVFDFSWLEEAIGILAEYSIETMLCTPTASQPKWLTDKHPDILQINEQGRQREFGKRRHYCINNKNYHFYTDRIVHELAEHFKNNDHVIGYQIDNEFMAEGPYCYCSTCTGEFRTWLKNKYGTIESLNKNWGTIFWGLSYRHWDEVEIPQPDHNSSAVLDYYRFFSDCFNDYAASQYDILKQVSPEKQVTHNICSSGFIFRMDFYKTAKFLDIMSIDNYPEFWDFEVEYEEKEFVPYNPTKASLALAMTRSYKKDAFWVTEAQVSSSNEPKLMRMWTYQELAHGSRMKLYFPWRSYHYSFEQGNSGILDYDSIGRRKYDAVKNCIDEIKKLPDEIFDARPFSEAALIRDFECDWAFEPARNISKNFRYMRQIHKYYESFVKNHFMIDVVSPDDELKDYKLIVVPSLFLMNSERAERLKEFARNGGTLIITFLSGVRTMQNAVISETMPGQLRELSGIELLEQDPLGTAHNQFISPEEGWGSQSKYNCATWCDVLKCNTAETIATYGSKFYKGTPAVTVNEYGKGRVYYIGTDVEAGFTQELIHKITTESGVQPTVKSASPSVEAVYNRNGRDKYIYLLNFSDSEQEINNIKPSVNMLTMQPVHGKHFIKPYDVLILKET